MAAELQIHENSALTTGTDKTSSTVRFKDADNATVDTSNPLVVPTSGYTYSYTKQLRVYMNAAPSSSVSNINWYSDGVNTFGTDIKVLAKNAGTNFVSNVKTLATSATDLFSYTSGTPLDGSVTDAGEWTPTDVSTYIGDIIMLQMEVGSSATNGVKNAETLTMSYDEV